VEAQQPPARFVATALQKLITATGAQRWWRRRARTPGGSADARRQRWRHAQRRLRAPAQRSGEPEAEHRRRPMWWTVNFTPRGFHMV